MTEPASPVASVPVAIRPGRLLTPMQRGLYASQRRHPSAPMQNMALLTHIDGIIDGQRLSDAFETVVAASDALRTRILDDRGASVVRLSSAPQPSERIALTIGETTTWARARATRPIELTERAYDSVIIDHPDATSSWYLCLHHTITDATSSSLVFDTTAAAYRGEPIELDSYYRWADSLDTDDRNRRASAHWRQRPVAPGIGALYRPHDTRSTASSRHALHRSDRLDEQIQAALRGRYRMVNDDLAWTTLMITSLGIYLHRISGSTRFSIGLPVHNRRTPATKSLIGPLMEVYPVDVSIEDDDTFASVQARVARSVLTTLRNATPGAAPTPDFEAVVNVIARAALGTFSPDGTTELATSTTWIPTGAIEASHLVRFQRTAYGSGDELILDINDAVAPLGADGDAVEHLRRVLDDTVTHPDRPIHNAGLCTPDELARLRDWESGPAQPEPVQDVSEALRAGLATDRVVVVDGERSLTGHELCEWIDRLARWLQDRNVGPGERIALDLPRSGEAIAAIGAVLAVGGSYLPLDPTHPQARRQRLITRAGASMVLDTVPDLDTLRAGQSDSTTSQAPTPRPDSEAYLLFTSGSTGEPKGVPIRRDGLSRYLAIALANYASGRCDGAASPIVAPLFGSLTFDLTVTSLFLPLISGGCCVVIAEEGPSGLAAVARRSDLTWCKATPSHLEILQRLLPADHGITTFVVGGEAFGRDLALRLIGSEDGPGTGRAVFNEYGPTEAVVGCMIHRFDPEVDRGPDVPIGAPMPGVTLRVVDSHRQRVPIGAAGELCIAGPGLTTGYLDPPAEDPFVELDGRRFYRTGDLVRMVDDRTLVYLGRRDEQVKVGGIRLEPTEVEAALCEHPAIVRAAVRLWSPAHRSPSRHCVRCGLPDNVPDVAFDADGVCSTCLTFDRVAPVAASWFGSVEDLYAIRDEARATRQGRFDCLHLLSGGKDSTYALHRLVELGFEPYVLTLDNGFISDQAKENIARTIAELGLEHEFATTPAMNEIFRDSLDRHANVCHGCYKTIYTLATNRADELGIPVIVTGLSRGQLFETRLVPQQFSLERFDPDAIDRAVLQARKAYHRIDDGPRRLLDTSVFDDDTVFDRIRYVDIYRYLDVALDELLSYLDREAPWVRPTDTGRSTNCRVNDVGIHTHLLEQGYHNYAVPYAWDVRLGHKTRNEAMAELDDRLDPADVRHMLSAIGYQPTVRRVLTAWIEVDDRFDHPPTPAELRTHLSALLPAHAIPSAFVVVDLLPMAASGKLDTASLPAPRLVNRRGPSLHVEPRTPLESQIIGAWESILRIEPIGIDDDFFSLGGDSLAALEMILGLADGLDVVLSEDLAFANTSPRALAEAIAAITADPSSNRASDLTSLAPPPPRGSDIEPPFSDSELAVLFEARVAGSTTSTGRSSGSARLNVGHLHRVDGAIDHARFRRAATAVASLHQPLSWTYSVPRRRLDPATAIEFDISDDPVDLDGFDVGCQVEHFHRRPFDLDNGPLLRVMIRRGVDATTAILIVVHHVSADAEGLVGLLRQIDDAYSERTSDPLPTDYAGFMAWQSDLVTDTARSFWLGQPDGNSILAVVPGTCGPDGFVRRRSSLTPRALRQTAGVSGASMALVALATVIDRRADGDTIEVGLIASTRSHPASRPLVGYFLNTLPLALPAPTPDSSFAQHSEATSRLLGQVLAHRTVPLAGILSDRRAAGRHAEVPQILFAFDELPDATFAGRPSRHDVLFNGVAVAPLTVFIEVRSDGIDLAAEYRGSIFTGDQIEDLLDDLDAVLVAGTGDPTLRPADLTLPSARHGRLTGPELAESTDLFATIEANLRGRSERPAVIGSGARISWAELDDRTRRLAGRLAETGVVAGDRVIIALPRSIDLIVAVVAAIRLGASYVPMDPTYPAARRARIALASKARVAVIPDGADQVAEHCVTMSEDTGAPSTDTGDSPAVSIEPDHEAYVIFTSGSTGVPRGVPVTRRNLDASTRARSAFYSVGPGRFLLVSSLAFDSSVAGLFWTLASGGTIVVPTDDEVRDADRLIRRFADDEITHTLLVPSLYRALLDRLERGAPTTPFAWPGVVIVAGEASSPALVEQHARLVNHGRSEPQSELYNEYGPTEATVWSTVHHCRPGEDPVPIGTPIPGTSVAVIDARGRVRPRGMIGELVVNGPGVTAGYLGPDGLADRTHAAFAPLATWAEPEPSTAGHTFRTGDRVAIVDGRLQFLGRLDHQLNVGGVRVEPEEIEATMATIDGIAEVVVVATDSRSLDQLVAIAGPDTLRRAMTQAAAETDPAPHLRGLLSEAVGPDLTLVAHIELTPGATLDALSIRRKAGELLAATQRPQVVMVHERLPRTPNGKLDREAARLIPVRTATLAPQSPSTGSDPDVPATSGPIDPSTLRAVAAIFAEVLRLDRIEPDDSFLDLGGHSILALRLIQNLDTRLGLDVSLTAFYRRPTPRGVVESATPRGAVTGTTAQAHRYVLDIAPDGERTPLFGVHVLGVNGAFYRPLAEHLGADQPVYGLGLAGAVPDDSTPHQLFEMSSAYADEVERIRPTGPVALAAVSVGAIPAIELAKRLEERGRTVTMLALFDAAGPDSFEYAPAGRDRLALHAQALRQSPTRYVRDRAAKRAQVLKRDLERLEISARSTLSRPLPDRLRQREFVEKNVANAMTHRPQPVEAPIVVFKAGDDLFTASLAQHGMGWSAFSAGGVEVIEVAGGHLSMLAEPHVGALALRMSERLVHFEDHHQRRSNLAEGRLALETDLQRALDEGTLSLVLPSWTARRKQIDSDALDLLEAVERTAADLGRLSRKHATTVSDALAVGGVAAMVVPPPTLAAYAAVTVIVDSDTDAAAGIIESLGYRRIADTSSRFLDASGTCRVEVVSGAADTDDRSATARASGRRGDDDSIVDLGIFLATPPGLIAPTLDLAGPSSDDLVLDLGCGDGRVLIAAAERYGCRGRGVEIDPALVAQARQAVTAAGLDDRIEIVEGDATAKGVLEGASVVFAFLPSHVVDGLLPAILAALTPDQRFITHEQLAVPWSIEPDERRLVFADGITVAHRWNGRGSG